MAERSWTTADFDYQLPPELIAQAPSSTRGASRLLVVDPTGSTPEDARFEDLPGLLEPGDVMVVNSSKVRHARLHGSRESGGSAEVLLLHPLPEGGWLAMGKPGRALRPGRVITFAEGIGIETVAVREDGLREIRFFGARAETVIDRFGKLPLPPYITREPDSEDEERYQTVYADREGSVAAPTAGLHFTDQILEQIQARGIRVVEVDLEVGPGTFRPVEEDDPRSHPMHSERYRISTEVAEEIANARAAGGSVWAIGTTVVRALESAAGDDGSLRPGEAETDLMIMPGYRFKVVDSLVTNFHLPRSTLLMLVAAFGGYATMMAAYRHAVAHGYSFFSYGDAMCIRERLR